MNTAVIQQSFPMYFELLLLDFLEHHIFQRRDAQVTVTKNKTYARYVAEHSVLSDNFPYLECQFWWHNLDP